MSIAKKHPLVVVMLVVGVALGVATVFVDFGEAANIIAELSGGLVTFSAAWLVLDSQYRRRALAIRRRQFREIASAIGHFALAGALVFENGGVGLGPILRIRERDYDAPQSLRELAQRVRADQPVDLGTLLSQGGLKLVDEAAQIVSLATQALDGLEQFSEADALLVATDQLDMAVSSLRSAVWRGIFKDAPGVHEPMAAVLEQCAAVYDSILPLWVED